MAERVPAELYGLIGFPLGHSFSQTYFNQKFESEHIDARYINFEIPDIGDITEVISQYPNLRGFNVTKPYKEQIIPYLKAIDPVAERIGAVNVVKVDQTDTDFRLTGYNSDIVGFTDSIRPLLKPDQRKALVLGTGGASKAICEGLLSLGIKPQLVSRAAKEGVITYADLTPEIMESHLVIVNTTPLGLYPHIDEAPDIPYHLLTPDHLCYDLIYNPDTTKFMKLAAERGAEVKNGLEMLLLQAFESWRIWKEL